MAKVTAPLLGFGAAGQIGKTQVYGTWRGVPYARKHVIPANPKTAEQTKTRGAFAWINQVWKQLSPAVQAVWTASAKGMPLIDRNAFIKSNLAALRGTTLVPVTTLAGMVMSPGVNGGLASASMSTADATGHHATVTLVKPDLPTGWAIVKAHAVCIKQQDAKTGTTYESFYASDDTDPYAVDVDCKTADTFECFAFFEYTKPDGSTAFSPSRRAQQVLA
jgi:uncharacterized protein YbdZ (MbtH family)